MIIIGLVGKKYSGKDTFVNQTKAIWSDKIINRLSLGDFVKEELVIAINSVNAVKGTPFKEPITIDFINKNKSKFRLLMQSWGTEYRRDLCGQNYWTEQFLRKILAIRMGTIICVPDVRFQNEADMIKDIGGHLVKIIRPGHNIDGDTHSSETELESIDCEFEVFNSGTLPEMATKTRYVLDAIKRQHK